MKAVQLTGFNGIDSLKVVELDSPKPQAHELLIKVEAAGINFADSKWRKENTRPGRTCLSSWGLKLPRL